MQWGVAGFASVYGAKELGWEQVWESVAAGGRSAPEKKCVVLLYLAGGNDGLNIAPAQRRRRLLGYYAAARPNIHRRPGRQRRRPRRLLGAAGPGRRARWRSPTVGLAATDNNGGDDYGFDTLYGDGTGGPGSDLAVMPAVDAKKYSLSHFDNSDLWFEASYRPQQQDGLAGPLDRPQRRPNNPLQAVSIDTALSKAIRTTAKPVCAISSLPMNGFKPTGSLPPRRVQQHDGAPDTRRSASSRVAARRGQRLPRRARARPTA